MENFQEYNDFRFQDLDIKLINIDRKELNNLLHPLLGVRQACTHPQVSPDWSINSNSEYLRLKIN